MADESNRVSLYKEIEQEELSPESTFNFHCHSGLACFNQCCRTPTILLSPYDLLRLKQALGLTAGEILGRYTIMGTDEASNLPLAFVDAFQGPGGCPFLGAEGCTVYAHRPAACRLFPITMGSRLTSRGVEDHYFCRRLPYCAGFDCEVQWTLAAWQTNQGFAEYDLGRREWLEVLLKTALKGPVADELRHLVATVAYDLDEFRRLLLTDGLPSPVDLAGQARPELETDDLALLKISYRYLRTLL